MNKLIFILFLFLVGTAQAQQLECKVVVNAEQTGRANLSVFKTLETAIEELMNQTQWVDESLEDHEKINCGIYLNITQFDGNNFSGTLQIQSSRPVFNTTYDAPVFNFNDEQVAFTYTEHEPLEYDRNNFDSNLTSILAFYAYTILGLDADTFELEAGDPFYNEASQVVGIAQQGNAAGWKPTDGNNSRYRLINDLLSNTFINYRKTMYNYHRHGLDKMVELPLEAKENMAAALLNLEEINKRRGNARLLRVFFDAKAAEIEKVFSAGPEVTTEDLVNALNNMAPSHSENWSNIQ